MKKTILLRTVLFGLAMTLVLPGFAAATDPLTINGSIERTDTVNKSADKHMDNSKTADNDSADFVFVTGNDTYWYLPNVPSSLKSKILHEPVQVTGEVDKQAQTIEVDKILNDGEILWCKRGVIYDENALYPVKIPDLCS